MTSTTQYDAMVIGAGQAGEPLSTALAQAGRKTALIERVHVGGTCINEGCTPTKPLLRIPCDGRSSTAWLQEKSRSQSLLSPLVWPVPLSHNTCGFCVKLVSWPSSGMGANGTIVCS